MSPAVAQSKWSAADGSAVEHGQASAGERGAAGVVSSEPGVRDAAALPVGAVSTVAVVDESRYLELVNQLVDEDWRVRTAAHEQLVRIGLPAVAALEAARSGTDNERRAAVGQVLAAINEQRRSGATAVTVHANQGSLADVLAAVSAQSGFTLELPAGLQGGFARQPVSISANARPLWEVVHRICATVKGRPIMPLDRPGVVVIVPDPAGHWATSPHHVVGPVMVVARTVTAQWQSNVGGPANRSATIGIQVFAEPKVGVLRNVYAAEMITALDAGGEGLWKAPPLFPVDGLASAADASTAYLSLWLHKDVRGPLKVRGAVSLETVSKSELYAWDNPATRLPRTAQAGGNTVTLQSLTEDDAGWTCDVVIPIRMLEVDSLRRESRFPTSWRLIDAQGRRLNGLPAPGRPTVYTSTGEAIAAVSFSYTEREPFVPVRLEWDAPVRTAPMPIEFELDRVPLPWDADVKPADVAEAARQQAGQSR